MDRKKNGLELMKVIFGNEAALSIEQDIKNISSDFLNFLQETFGDIYSDKTLDLKTKEIVVISTLITQKDTKPQLKAHIRASLRAGITREEILAIIRHLILYVGFPSAINALHTAKEVFEEANEEKRRTGH